MPLSHILLALLVIFIWGSNFIFITMGLTEISPLLLCTLRFFFASIPAIFFIKPPAIPFRMVIAYGLIMFGMQFGLLFVAMHVGMTAGLASLLLQVQVFFSMVFAAIALGEMLRIWQIAGALIAFIGIGIVGAHVESHVSLEGFIFVLAAAASWGIGNLITKKVHHQINAMALVVWGSFVAIIPMFILSLLFEGPQSMVYTYHHLTWRGITALAYIVYGASWIGYGVWSFLLSRYPVNTIVPFTLLVPIVGVAAAILVLHEPFQSWKLLAGAFVLLGLCINIFGGYWFKKSSFLGKLSILNKRVNQ